MRLDSLHTPGEGKTYYHGTSGDSLTQDPRHGDGVWLTPDLEYARTFKPDIKTVFEVQVEDNLYLFPINPSELIIMGPEIGALKGVVDAIQLGDSLILLNLDKIIYARPHQT